MEYLNILAYYLTIGLIITLVMEFCVNQIEKYLIESDEEKDIIPWGNIERVLTIAFWPYTIILLLTAIITFTTKNK